MPPRSGPLPFALNIAITNAWISQLFDQELEKRGIAPFQSGTLMVLHRYQPVTPSDLQAVMGVPSTTLRNRLNELVAAGLVERIPHPQDGRSHLLRTTAAAQDVVKESKTAGRPVTPDRPLAPRDAAAAHPTPQPGHRAPACEGARRRREQVRAGRLPPPERHGRTADQTCAPPKPLLT
jgi:DNA-binding MarR family transcriptional regulator